MTILILGSNGLVGHALTKRLKEKHELLTPSKEQLNLLNRQEIEEYFSKNDFDTVINAAGLVGGIHANSTSQSDFLYQNILIQVQPLEIAAQKGAKKYFNLASSCIYPKLADQPISENSLLTGELEPTNEGYALAKIAGTKLAQFLAKEGRLKATTLMPTNIFGYEKVQNIEDAHVITALIERFIHAHKMNAREVIVWGSGKALREFMHVDEFADAMDFLLGHAENLPPVLNIGTGHEISIRDLAYKLKEYIGLEATIVFDQKRPEGVLRKCIDSSFLKNLGWRPLRSFNESLRLTVEDFMREAP